MSDWNQDNPKRVAHRGGAPVGYLEELGPVEAGAVIFLRRWGSGEYHKAQIANEFCQTMGAKRGCDVCKSFHALCDLCVRHGRRQLMRHAVGCKCLGADEACFANFVGYASEGAREDALLMATLIVRPDFAPCLVGLAEEFGLALKAMALSTAGRPIEPQPKQTIH